MQRKTSTVTLTLRNVSIETVRHFDFSGDVSSEVSLVGKKDEKGMRALRFRIGASRYQMDTQLRTLEDSVLCARYLVESGAITMEQKVSLLKTAAQYLPISECTQPVEQVETNVIQKMKTLPVFHDTADAFFRSSDANIRFRLDVVFSCLRATM